MPRRRWRIGCTRVYRRYSVSMPSSAPVVLCPWWLSRARNDHIDIEAPMRRRHRMRDGPAVNGRLAVHGDRKARPPVTRKGIMRRGISRSLILAFSTRKRVNMSDYFIEKILLRDILQT
ncbi:hypothetical protein ACS0PU_008653 [Formica fusca]